MLAWLVFYWGNFCCLFPILPPQLVFTIFGVRQPPFDGEYVILSKMDGWMKVFGACLCVLRGERVALCRIQLDAATEKFGYLSKGRWVYLFVCSHIQNYIFRTKLTYNVYLSMDLHHLRIECINGSWWNKLMMLSRSELDWGWYFMFIALFGACGSFHLLRIIGLSFKF